MTQKLMNQKDRAELRRILKARFTLLHQQLQQRQREVQSSIEKQIRDQNEDAIKTAHKKTEAFKKKLEKLQEEAVKLTADMYEAGVVPGDGRFSPDSFFSYTLMTKWAPANLNKKVNEAYQRVAEQAGLHQIDLNMQQLELEEELAIGALGSEEAREFLGKVPSLDKLLPMNGNVTAALNGSNDDDDYGIIEGEVSC